jgi:hypothetical protein
MTDQSMQTITADVEKELIDEIIKNLDQAKITVKQARETAREFLALLPMQDKKDLVEKLYKLKGKHSETSEIYLEYAKSFEEEDRQKKLTLMSEHIKNGKIDEALAVAKEGKPVVTKTQ